MIEREHEGVWVFNGQYKGFPSGVFTEKGAAVRWINTNKLTGTLTWYPLNVGAYDWAIQNRLFTPKNDEQRTPHFIATFTTAGQEHYHFEDGIQG